MKRDERAAAYWREREWLANIGTLLGRIQRLPEPRPAMWEWTGPDNPRPQPLPARRGSFAALLVQRGIL